MFLHQEFLFVARISNYTNSNVSQRDYCVLCGLWFDIVARCSFWNKVVTVTLPLVDMTQIVVDSGESSECRYIWSWWVMSDTWLMARLSSPSCTQNSRPPRPCLTFPCRHQVFLCHLSTLLLCAHPFTSCQSFVNFSPSPRLIKLVPMRIVSFITKHEHEGHLPNLAIEMENSTIATTFPKCTQARTFSDGGHFCSGREECASLRETQWRKHTQLITYLQRWDVKHDLLMHVNINSVLSVFSCLIINNGKLM